MLGRPHPALELMKLHRAKIIVLCLVALMLLGAAKLFLPPGPLFSWQERRAVKRVLAADPQQLLVAGRLMLQQRPGFTGTLPPSSPDIPAVIRKLDPAYISFTTNSVAIDFGHPANPFGIVVFAPGEKGQGRHEWISGLWLFHDGQLHSGNLPAKVQP
jgi:hypothetical protein